LVSGKPPSVLRSQIGEDWITGLVVAAVVVAEGGGGERWVMSILKTPPVEGWREISPREVEKVWRSSWANCAEEIRKAGESCGRDRGGIMYIHMLL
jgi:hypothetical protein